MIKKFFINKQEKRLRSLWRIISQICMMFLMFIIIAKILVNITSLLNWDEIIRNNDVYHDTYVYLIFLIATMISIMIISNYIDKRDISEFGIEISYAWTFDFICGFLIGGFIIFLILLIELNLDLISEIKILNLNSETLLVLLTYIFVAIYEELLFRGYLLLNLSEGLYFKKYINKKLSIVLAIILSSIMFSLIHWSGISNNNVNTLLMNLFNNFIFGVLLSLAFIYTGKMAIPIGFHLAYNFFLHLYIEHLEYNLSNHPVDLFGFSTMGLWKFFGLIVVGILLYILIKTRYKELILKI